jgi:hypothetical protein
LFQQNFFLMGQGCLNLKPLKLVGMGQLPSMDLGLSMEHLVKFCLRQLLEINRGFGFLVLTVVGGHLIFLDVVAI